MYKSLLVGFSMPQCFGKGSGNVPNKTTHYTYNSINNVNAQQTHTHIQP